jgi:hypothetical protein
MRAYVSIRSIRQHTSAYLTLLTYAEAMKAGVRQQNKTQLPGFRGEGSALCLLGNRTNNCGFNLRIGFFPHEKHVLNTLFLDLIFAGAELAENLTWSIITNGASSIHFSYYK